ncbi:MAG TPA: FecR family protein, partial [Candidatus Sumerlaeota bacterium]|nr:FecR family protein [Candidatus Sumerlaeota bacterium]
MRNNRPLIISFACVIALIILMSGADEVHLKGGTVIRGRIAEEGTESVKVENPDLGLLTFPRERIEKIVRDAPQITASPTHAAPPASDAPVLRPVAATDDVLDGYDAVLFGVVNEVHVGPEGKNWFPAASFMQLKVRDEIRTGLGKTRIKLRGRGEVRLPPNSQMLLALVEGNGTQVTIELKGGRVWNQITPGGGIVNYTIKTPDLVAGVQGTLFKVSLDEAEGARLAVFEGRVAATAPRSARSPHRAPPDVS